MKKKIAILLLCTVPAILFLNVWQVFRYESLKKEVLALDSEQKEWLEKNKRMIAGIAVLSSPVRIDKLAKEVLKLRKLNPGETITIRLSEDKQK